MDGSCDTDVKVEEGGSGGNVGDVDEKEGDDDDQPALFASNSFADIHTPMLSSFSPSFLSTFMILCVCIKASSLARECDRTLSGPEII
jgi:hypothetical protein